MIDDDGLGHFGSPRKTRGGFGIGTAALLWALATVYSGAAGAQEGVCPQPDAARLPQLWWSACAAPEATPPQELALPLPVDGASMMFVEVRTPGAGVFEGCASVEARLPVYGAADDPFSPPSRQVVGGAFRDDDSWRYFLAKYELTVGQAAAILAGDPETGEAGALTNGLQALADLLDDGAGHGKLEPVQHLLWRFRMLSFGVWTSDDGQIARSVAEHLARPVAGLTAAEFDALAERYTAWCYHSSECRGKLEQRASFDGALGFIRLPSRLEWEHAARGGAAGAEENAASSLDATAAQLPFDPANIDQYANLGDAARDADAPSEAVVGVGRKPTPGGFYDLYGNIAELTADFFDSGAQGGKLGGRAIRGGWFGTPPAAVSAGLTEELRPFAFDQATGAFLGPERNAYTGARFAIGSVVKTSPQLVETASVERREKSCAGGSPDMFDTAQIATHTAAPAEPKADPETMATIETLRRNVEETGQAHCRTLAEKLFLLARLQINYWSQSLELDPAIRDTEDEVLRAADKAYYEQFKQQLRRQKARLEHTSRKYLETYMGTAVSMAENEEQCIRAGFDSFEDAESVSGLLAPDPSAEGSGSFAREVLDQVREHVRQTLEAADPMTLKEDWQTDFIEIGRQSG